MSPLEILIRGTLMFWFLFLILRFVLKRDVGSAGISHSVRRAAWRCGSDAMIG
jgi:hypothetical protein